MSADANTPRVACEQKGIAFAPAVDGRLNAYHPSLSLLSETEWLVTHDLGTSTESLDYHTRALRTTDAGATWVSEAPLVVKPETPPTTHTIRTRRLSGRRLLGLGKWENRQGYETQRSNRETLGQVPMRLFWIESIDGGRKWSEPRWIVPPIVGPTWELCHPLIELPDRSWAAPVATWRGWDGDLPNGEMTGLLVSRDGGATWPDFVVSFDGRGTGYIHWEQSVAVRRDGSLVVTSWVYDPAKKETRPSLFTTSRDGGRSFAAPRPTGFLAQTCKILELKSGRIMAVYRRHDRPGLWVEVARVDESGWHTERRGLLWGGVVSGMEGKASTSEELNKLRFGYPSLAELGDGSVVLVFWGTEGGPNAIYWMRFNPASVPACAGA